MKHLWKGAVALAFLGALIATAGPGCVANESSMFIKNVIAPSCAVITTDSVAIGFGVLDVRYTCEYNATLVLGNQLVRRGDDNKLQAETSRIEIKKFDIQVLDAGFAPLNAPGGADKFTVAADGFLDPESGGTPGVGLTDVQLVDGAVGQYLYEKNISDIVVRMKAHGRTLGGQDLTSAEFDFPIKVCKGCLCVTPPDDTCVNPTAAPKDQCLLLEGPFDCRWIGANCSDQFECGVAVP